MGPKTAGVAGYYAGAATHAARRGQRADGGRAAHRAARRSRSRRSEQLTVAVTYRKLLEVTHFHLFTLPVFLLIIAHLFMLTGLSSTAEDGVDRRGLAVGAGAPGGAVAHPLRRRGVELHATRRRARLMGLALVGDDGLSDDRDVAAAPARVRVGRKSRPHAHLPRVAQTVLAGRATRARFRSLLAGCGTRAAGQVCARPLCLSRAVFRTTDQPRTGGVGWYGRAVEVGKERPHRASPRGEFRSRPGTGRESSTGRTAGEDCLSRAARLDAAAAFALAQTALSNPTRS